ncbi:hypothetical protein Tco_1268388 [Tanacetum coccineum]
MAHIKDFVFLSLFTQLDFQHLLLSSEFPIFGLSSPLTINLANVSSLSVVDGADGIDDVVAFFFALFMPIGRQLPTPHLPPPRLQPPP